MKHCRGQSDKFEREIMHFCGRFEPEVHDPRRSEVESSDCITLLKALPIIRLFKSFLK